MKHSIFALFFVLSASLFTSAWAAQPLLTPKELSNIDHKTNVRVIDIRPAKKYADGHIPGAVSASYAQWRGPADNPGKLPSKDDLTSLVRSLGLDADTHAVVVSTGQDASDFGASARVYWTLKYLGLNDLSILNGGYKAWEGNDLPENSDTPEVSSTDYVLNLNKNLIAKTNDVAKQVGNANTRLIDARPHKYYVGDVKAPTSAVAGTIKGAVNLQESAWFKPGTGIFVSPEKAKQIAKKRLNKPAQETISFCNTGHWAATDWFALSEVAGVNNVRLYPQSLAAWTQHSDLPMQNVPSRSQQILNKVKGLFN